MTRHIGHISFDREHDVVTLRWRSDRGQGETFGCEREITGSVAAHLAVDGVTGKYPEFKGNVATIYTNPMAQGGRGNGHYGGKAEVYMDVGEAMGQAMVERLKGAKWMERQAVVQQAEPEVFDLLADIWGPLPRFAPSTSKGKPRA